jgi:putative ABC transport system permease protein
MIAGQRQADDLMRTALYWSRATRADSWRAVLAMALLGGLLGAVTLGALAGARRTVSAYASYLASIHASDAFVNVPGAVPGVPLTRPMTLISRLPGVAAGAAYVGLNASPVVNGRVDDSFLTNSVTGALSGPSFSADGFGQDRLTVLAGRLPAPNATNQIALTPRIAALFGVGVGGRVTYQFYRQNLTTFQVDPIRRVTFGVTGIVDIPPVLVDQSDAKNSAVLPPGATRRLLTSYVFAWVGVRLDRGAAGIPALQGRLATLATSLQRLALRRDHLKLPDLTFSINRSDITHAQVQQAIRPQAIALAVFGAITALAMLVLVSQGIAQLLSRSAPDISAARALGATRAQAALAVSLPAAVATLAAMILAVAGAVLLSPLAPVGPVRRFDPARGLAVDGLALGAGSVLLTAILAGLLAVMAARAVRPQAGRADGRASVIARAAAAAGLPTYAVLGSRNALQPGSGQRGVRAALLGAITAVTAVTAVAVFGASLTGLITHPERYGWNWNVLIQAEGGYGNWSETTMNRLVDGQPAVAGWSSFGFGQLPVDGAVVPVLGLQRNRGSVEPPTISGHPITGDDQIELGTVTLRALGKHIGDTVLVGSAPYRRRLTIVGTVTLPSFGVALTDHVSLGRGAMVSERALLGFAGATSENLRSESEAAQQLPSAVAIDLVPGTSAAQRARLVRHITSANPDGTPGGTYELAQHPGAAVVNASKMGEQPLTLALGLAAAAVLSLALTVFASVRRRRREYALLKTLGLSRGQLRAVVAWQTSTILLVAAMVGVPLGIAAGRLAWVSFANSLGAMPATVTPVLTLLLGAVTLLATGNLLAAAPGAAAARTPAAAVLRSE